MFAAGKEENRKRKEERLMRRSRHTGSRRLLARPAIYLFYIVVSCHLQMCVQVSTPWESDRLSKQPDRATRWNLRLSKLGASFLLIPSSLSLFSFSLVIFDSPFFFPLSRRTPAILPDHAPSISSLECIFLSLPTPRKWHLEFSVFAASTFFLSLSFYYSSFSIFVAKVCVKR